MKALFLMVCFLLASSLIIPTFTMAREVVRKEHPIYRPPRRPNGGRVRAVYPRNRPVKKCGRGKPSRYCLTRP